MKRCLFLLVGTWAISSVAHAQTASEPSKGYVEAVAQSAFGNITSQSYGAEGGIAIVAGLQVFAEGGRIRTVEPAAMGLAAQMIAGALTQSQNATVSYSTSEPATFFSAGVRYMLPIAVISEKVRPYIMGGGGVAKVERKAVFKIGGTDVTANLLQYGVRLGTDLSGSFTKPMLTLGGGFAWSAWRQVVIDLQYRYGRISSDDGGINTHRAGAGLGVRF